jgi:hypothetical protein
LAIFGNFSEKGRKKMILTAKPQRSRRKPQKQKEMEGGTQERMNNGIYRQISQIAADFGLTIQNPCQSADSR